MHTILLYCDLHLSHRRMNHLFINLLLVMIFFFKLLQFGIQSGTEIGILGLKEQLFANTMRIYF